MKKTLIWFTAVLVPLALLALALRLLLTPQIVALEYRTPNFPPDPYGFSQSERIYWSKYAVDYLTNRQAIAYLADLTFPDGTPLYNDRELRHMEDVKYVVQPSLRIGLIAWVALAGLWVWSRYLKRIDDFKSGLRIGGMLMLGLVALVGAFAAISFWQFFTVFHSIFFEGDSWLFYHSDTLIRLFPIRFWQDMFLYAGVIVVTGALLLVLGLKPTTK